MARSYNMIIGFVAILLIGVGFYWFGNVQGVRQATKQSVVVSNVAPQSGAKLINSFHDNYLEMRNPQTGELSTLAIDETAVIQLADEKGIFQLSDSKAFQKDAIAITSIESGIVHVDVIPNAQSR